MQKSRLLTLLVITTLLVSIFIISSLMETANATITTPSVDTTAGSHAIKFSANPTTLSITTSTTQEIIYATCYSKTSGKSLTISSSPALTWHYRGGGNTSGSNGEIAAWWAVSATAQSITITFSGSSTGGSVMSVFCIKNANTNSPFDPNLTTASYNSGSSTTASCSLTTSNSNNLLISVISTSNNKAITAGSGYTQIDNTGTSHACSGASEYLQVSTEGSYTPNYSMAASAAWVEVADAFVPASQSITITSSPQTGSGYITVNGTAQTTPYTATWTPGTVLALSATGTVSGGIGKQYVYSSWSDSGAQTHYYTVQSASETVTANYQTQYQVSFIVNPSGSGVINQADGYYAESTIITATPASGYSFDHWSADTGSISFNDASSSSTTMVTTGTGTVTATFTLKTYPTLLTVTANNDTIDKGNTLTITGTLTSQGTPLSGKTIVLSYYDISQWQQIGSVVTQSDGGYQYLWTVPSALTNGQYTIKADFAGDSPYLASSSTESENTLMLTVLPENGFGAIIAFIVCLAAVFIFYRHSQSAKNPSSKGLCS
jgi:5-hydroxyisourate hydrolase-like protein (transthyretin family)